MIWKHLVGIAHLLRLLWPLLALLALFSGAGNRRVARSLNDRVKFAPGWVQFGAWTVLVIYPAYGAADSIMHNQGTILDFVNGVGLALISILFLSLFPGTIIVGDDGIRQIYWFSTSKHIRWEEIVEIKTGKKERAVTITGANRTKIIHSNPLPDRARLLLELKERCGENLPSDFPRESINPPISD